MHIAVFGATGPTGRQLLAQAVRRGHRVTALSRRPDVISEAGGAVEVVVGDVFDPFAVARTVAGADCVISALGIGYRRHATTVYSVGTGNVMAAMGCGARRRLVVVSTGSVELPPPRRIVEWLFFKHVLQRVLRRPYADVVAMEHRVRSSDTDWTVVRAARLTNGRRRGGYRTAVDAKLPGGWSISRADLAHDLLDRVEETTSAGHTVEIAY